MRKPERLTIEKLAVTAVLVLCWILMPVTGYDDGDSHGLGVGRVFVGHVLYMLSHANVWHLAGNLFVLWLLRQRLYLLPSVAIAFLCSWIPAIGLWPLEMTVGFSGVIFAVFGIKWGVYCRSFAEAGRLFERAAVEEFCMKALPFALIGIIIPHVNWCLHLYCILAGFLYGRYCLSR